jgi:hypothetical protein
MVSLVVALAIVLCGELEAQDIIRKYASGFPPLPSAGNLAKGKAETYADSVYQLNGGRIMAAYNADTKLYQEKQEVLKKAEPIAEGVSLKRVRELLAQFGEPKGKWGAPRTQAQITANGELYRQDSERLMSQQMSQQKAASGTGGLLDLDIAALSKMSEKEAEDYASKMVAGFLGVSDDEAKKLTKMSDKEMDEYALKTMAEQTGLSMDEAKAVSEMSDDEIDAFMLKRAKEGSPEEQAFNKAKQDFDAQRTDARAVVARRMEALYKDKYQSDMTKVEEDMDKFFEIGFAEGYDAASAMRDDLLLQFRTECFALWRTQIEKEQQQYSQLCNTQLLDDEDVIMDGYIDILLDILQLPDLEVIVN